MKPFSVKASVLNAELKVRASKIGPDHKRDDDCIPKADTEPLSCGLDNICAYKTIKDAVFKPQGNVNWPNEGMDVIEEESNIETAQD